MTMTRDTRAVWQYEPISQTWSLWLIRNTAVFGFELAVRQPDGRIQWERRDPAAATDDPPLLRLEDWILTEIVLPAAPGAPRPEQAAGRVEALAEALQIERGRVDKLLDRLVT